MPLVSSFFGIQIYIYYRDHGLPHYHAFYQGFEATILISNGHLLAGELPLSVCRILVIMSLCNAGGWHNLVKLFLKSPEQTNEKNHLRGSPKRSHSHLHSV